MTYNKTVLNFNNVIFVEMVSRTSRRLPIKGRDHTFIISELSNAQHSLEQAEKHYQIVKRKQCIADYNIAVKDLDNVYEKLLHIDDITEKVESKLNDLKVEKEGLEILLDDCKNQLVLAKAKLQQLNVASSALLKLEKTQKARETQTESKSTGTGEGVSAATATDVEPQNILSIPDDEDDIAIKNVLNELKTPVVDLTLDTDVTTQNVVTMLSNTVMVTMQNIAPTPLVVTGRQTMQNVAQTPLNTAQTPLNIVTIGEKTDIIKAAMDLSELDPMPKTYIKIGNELFQLVQSIGQPTAPNKPQETVEPENLTPSKASDALNLPEGFMKTKFEDTIEKINPVAERNQKAGKRFFCSRCMANAIYTGYTKRFDLTKHLERCGKEVTDKPFSCSGYGDCEKSFARIENLRQHVASAHMKETLYKCKKCG